MARRIIVVAVLCLLGAGVAYAQNTASVRKFEGGVYPAGAIFFGKGSDNAEPGFGEYTFGGWGGYNINRWFGVTSEFGVGVAKRQNLNFALGQFSNVKTPYLANYAGSAVWHPRGNDRAIAPYLAGGLGGLTLYRTNGVNQFGFTSNPTFLTGNAGGGVKWYRTRNWGLQADYRWLAVKGKDNASPFFGLNRNRYGHRLAWNILLTR
jgi:hypothetical protein